MANEIKAFIDSGYTLYFVVRDNSGDVWYVSGGVFEDWGTGSRTVADYDISLTDNSGGMYIGSMDSDISAGYYWVIVHQQSGGSPADTDPPIYKEYGYWDGTSWITETNYLKTISDDIDDLQASGIITRNISCSTSILQRTERLIRRITGTESITYADNQIIRSAFNKAVEDICLDPQVPHWRFLQSEVNITTSSTVNYVDLGTNVYNIISGTVRIPSEHLNLVYKDIEVIKAIDPNEDITGPPQIYTFIASSTPEILRMRLWPVPDGEYSIYMTAETLPDTSSTADFPSWCYSVLEDKTKMNALIDLGLGKYAQPFEYSFKKRLTANRLHQGYDGPQHIKRQGALPVYNPGIESRIPS